MSCLLPISPLNVFENSLCLRQDFDGCLIEASAEGPRISDISSPIAQALLSHIQSGDESRIEFARTFCVQHPQFCQWLKSICSRCNPDDAMLEPVRSFCSCMIDSDAQLTFGFDRACGSLCNRRGVVRVTDASGSVINCQTDGVCLIDQLYTTAGADIKQLCRCNGNCTCIVDYDTYQKGGFSQFCQNSKCFVKMPNGNLQTVPCQIDNQLNDFGFNIIYPVSFFIFSIIGIIIFSVAVLKSR